MMPETTTAANAAPTVMTAANFDGSNVSPPAPTVQTWFDGTGNFSDAQNWLPPAPPVATNALIINRSSTLVATN
jgi:hypothetical protein